LTANKTEKFSRNFSDDGRDNLLSLYKLLSISLECSDISEEIKSLQRSIALIRQDITQIIRSELIRLNGEL